MLPDPDARSALYSGLIASSARPMAREDFECPDCGREYWSCECNSLPAYRGSDPSLYREESTNGDRR